MLLSYCCLWAIAAYRPLLQHSVWAGGPLLLCYVLVWGYDLQKVGGSGVRLTGLGVAGL